jgi:hypothetical protein
MYPAGHPEMFVEDHSFVRVMEISICPNSKYKSKELTGYFGFTLNL